MPFYSVTKFNILSPSTQHNESFYMLEQRWDLLEIYFETKTRQRRKLHENVLQNLFAEKQPQWPT